MNFIQFNLNILILMQKGPSKIMEGNYPEKFHEETNNEFQLHLTDEEPEPLHIVHKKIMKNIDHHYNYALKHFKR